MLALLALATACGGKSSSDASSVAKNDLAIMVLPAAELEGIAIGLEVDPDSGFQDAAAVAEDTIDPNDTEQDIESAGLRADYQLTYMFWRHAGELGGRAVRLRGGSLGVRRCDRRRRGEVRRNRHRERGHAHERRRRGGRRTRRLRVGRHRDGKHRRHRGFGGGRRVHDRQHCRLRFGDAARRAGVDSRRAGAGAEARDTYRSGRRRPRSRRRLSRCRRRRRPRRPRKIQRSSAWCSGSRTCPQVSPSRTTASSPTAAMSSFERDFALGNATIGQSDLIGLQSNVERMGSAARGRGRGAGGLRDRAGARRQEAVLGRVRPERGVRRREPRDRGAARRGHRRRGDGVARDLRHPRRAVRGRLRLHRVRRRVRPDLCGRREGEGRPGRHPRARPDDGAEDGGGARSLATTCGLCRADPSGSTVCRRLDRRVRRALAARPRPAHARRLLLVRRARGRRRAEDRLAARGVGARSPCAAHLGR